MGLSVHNWIGSRVGWRALIIGVVLSAIGLDQAATAQASPPAAIAITCGAVLHQDAYLAANLTCPTGNGLTVTSNINIDLRGHALTGSATSVGVTVDHSASLKITHGRLTGWGTGLAVASPNAPPNPMKAQNITNIAVTFLGNGTGVFPGKLPNADTPTPVMTIWRSWFVDNDVGLGGDVGNPTITVSGGAFNHNVVGVRMVGPGITLIGHLTLSQTELTGNQYAVICSESGCNLQTNKFSNNSVAVQTEGQATGLTLAGNTITGSEDGAANIYDTGHAVFTGNTFTDNSMGINLSNSSGNIVDNSFNGNGQAIELLVPTDRAQYPHAQVRGNHVLESLGDGIRLDGGSFAGAAFADNLATGNGGFGIYAPDAVDLGGNHASGNGSTPQCVGVIC